MSFSRRWSRVQGMDTVRELDGKTQGLQRHARSAGLTIFGTRLQQVNGPRLDATILMLQLERTGRR